MKIPIEKIRTDGGTQIRKTLNSDAVERYKETYEAEEKIKWRDPVVLFYDGEAYWIGDGFHRVEAAKQAGLAKIEAETKPGGQREALWYAMGANHKHGVAYTTKDKQRAVERALRDAEWVKLADRALARHCHVSPHTVNRVRKSLVGAGQIAQHTTRTYIQQGKRKRMDVSKINANRQKGATKPKSKEKPGKAKEKPKPKNNGYVRNCFGADTADQVIRLLETIRKTDTKRKEGLKMICDWLQAQKACECQGGNNAR